MFTGCHVPVSLSVNIGMLVFVVGLMVISLLSKPSGGRERERGGGGRGWEGDGEGVERWGTRIYILQLEIWFTV